MDLPKKKKVMAAAAGAVAFLIIEEEEMIIPEFFKRRHRFWMRKWMQEREDEGQNNTMYKFQQELLQLGDVDEFRATLRMPPDVYEELLEAVRPLITYQDTNFRKAISAEERLSMTMRYLALGDGYRSLRQQYRVGLVTVGKIVRDTCDALYTVLQPQYLVTPKTTEDWLEVAMEFENRWNIPHCLGALDGKHIRITAPPGSGSFFFNYKQYFSIILMGLVNARYEFIFVDVGAEGKASDGGVWKKSSLFELMSNSKNPLQIPKCDTINGIREKIPYFVVGDDAFALSPMLMKPFPNAQLTKIQKIFNYRCSRARIVVENAFGILSTRFRIFRREIEMRPLGAEKLVLACVVLHNMLRQKCGASYMPAKCIDYEDQNYQLVRGLWRKEPPLDTIDYTVVRNPTRYAVSLRKRLADFFLQTEGQVPWQYKCSKI